MNKELCVQTFVTDSQKIVVRPYEFISPYTEISNIGGQVIRLLASEHNSNITDVGSSLKGVQTPTHGC